VSARSRNPWNVVVVLASLFVLVNLVDVGAGNGGWPEIVGVPLGIAVAAYGVVRVLGSEGTER
jgi:hypothetical protein